MSVCVIPLQLQNNKLFVFEVLALNPHVLQYEYYDVTVFNFSLFSRIMAMLSGNSNKTILTLVIYLETVCVAIYSLRNKK